MSAALHMQRKVCVSGVRIGLFADQPPRSAIATPLFSPHIVRSVVMRKFTGWIAMLSLALGAMILVAQERREPATGRQPAPAREPASGARDPGRAPTDRAAPGRTATDRDAPIAGAPGQGSRADQEIA